VAEHRRLAADRDLVDRQLDRVELDRLRARRDHRAAQRDGPGDRALLRIDLDRERDVLDVDDTIGA